MHMGFLKQALQKFNKGQEEHGSGWEDIDPVSELKDECLDLYWYADHPKIKDKDPELSAEIKANARYYWRRIMYLDKD